MTKKNTFTSGFKAEAASLVLDKDYGITEASTAMGVSNSAMRRWVNQLEGERKGITPTKGKSITPEHQEIQALKAKVKQLELEKDILKKASALLMSDSYRSVK
ncbi:transposase [bacterium AH-315-K03]|nr:transposase [bacterium AH-315-K03]